MTSPSNQKPLAGWRVLVPRGGEWGNGIAATLRLKGAVPVIAPMINFASTENAEQLDEAIGRLRAGAYDWLVVTSATTVDVFIGHGVTVPSSTKIAAVGETTGVALTLAGYRVDFVPEKDNSARGLLKEWPAVGPRGRVLIPQSNVAEENLKSGVARLGLEAEFVTAYRTVGVPVPEQVASDVATGGIGAILITSGSVARQVQAQLAPLPEQTVVICIGPRTAYDARAAGIRVDLIAESRSADALVEALVDHVRTTTGS